MKRFTVRLSEEEDQVLTEVAEKEGISKIGLIRKLIEEAANPRLYKINAGHLGWLHEAAGVKKPDDLVEQLKELKKLNLDDPMSTEQKDEIALDLLQKERSEEILSDKEREFVNEWLQEQQIRRKNRDIMKKHGVEEKDLNSDSEAGWLE